jgi:hypothetical protein
VADKIELVGELTTLESGLVVAQRTKHLCRWCGAAFERDLGAQLHESQCRHGARLRLLGDALGGAVATRSSGLPCRFHGSSASANRPRL